MSDPGDVVLMRLPYPDETSGLNTMEHMYVRVGIGEFVKCQTLKPYHAFPGALPINRLEVDEQPFRHATLIDLDKLFIVNDGRGRTLPVGVSSELLSRIIDRLEETKFERIAIWIRRHDT